MNNEGNMLPVNVADGYTPKSPTPEPLPKKHVVTDPDFLTVLEKIEEIEKQLTSVETRIEESSARPARALAQSSLDGYRAQLRESQEQIMGLESALATCRAARGQEEHLLYKYREATAVVLSCLRVYRESVSSPGAYALHVPQADGSEEVVRVPEKFGLALERLCTLDMSYLPDKAEEHLRAGLLHTDDLLNEGRRKREEADRDARNERTPDFPSTQPLPISED